MIAWGIANLHSGALDAMGDAVQYAALSAFHARFSSHFQGSRATGRKGADCSSDHPKKIVVR